MEFSIIAAVDKKFGIGQGGKIPWNLPGDMAHFKDATTRQAVSGRQNAVIMGRGTWDSLPGRFRPLPGRLNVVLSRQAGLSLPPGVLQAQGLSEALEALATAGVGEVFVIGGGKVYAEAIGHPDCKTIYLTEIDSAFDCDTFFPPLPATFHKIAESDAVTEGNVSYRFVTYQR